MKYEIFIDGGFVGIPKEYHGEIVFNTKKKTKFIELMDTKLEPSEQIRDGLMYHIKIIDQGKEYKAVFDELALPELIRELIKSK